MWIIYLKQKQNTIGDSQYIYQNQLGKAGFQNGMVYGDFKDSPIRTISDKVLHDKAFSIAKNLKYDGYQREHASLVNENMLHWFIDFLIKNHWALILQVVLLNVKLCQTKN